MAEKLDMKSMNITEDNVRKIQALFPNVVTEIMGEDGAFKLAIDFDALKQELSNDLINEKQERYQMTWPDKSKAKLLANSRISATLRPDKEKSVNFDTTKNLYIEGDNLDVLKLLRETYLGKIKMIYIDPPYNTGNDFVYEDDFDIDAEDYKGISGDFDEHGNRLVKNLDSNGRFHTDWLNMMYPRLKIARDLLTDDGVIFISIDDNEQDNLKKICDEIYGSNNFVAAVIDAGTPKNNSKFFSIQHEYAFCYAKDVNKIPIDWTVEKNNVDEYMKRAKKIFESNLSEEEKHKELLELVKYPRFYDFDHYTYVDNRGIFRLVDMSAPGGNGARYEIIHPITKKPCKQSSRGWAYTQTAMQAKIDNNMVYFGVDEEQIPQQKYYLHENTKQTPRSIMYFDPQKTTKWLKKIGIPFDFVKPLDYMVWLLSCYPSNDYTVLDFFSGSATTAHAVMQLNAEDGGNRKFIMVQLPEKCEEKSEAYKAGYKTICEIGEERIRRAGKKIIEDLKICGYERKRDGYTLLASGSGGSYSYAKWKNNETGEIVTESRDVQEPKDIYKYYPNELDVGFRVFKLDSSNMNDVYYNPNAFNQSMLDMTVDNVKADRTPLDLLFQVMLDLGVELSADIVEKTVNGKKIYAVNGNDLIACFDNDIDNDVITAIATEKPLYAVFKDKSFATDSVGINNEQLFKTYSPATVVKVI